VEGARREALEADFILAPSAYVESTLREIGVRPERILVLPYGVRADRFAPAQGNPRKEHPFRILYVGQISQRKGLAYLLEAVRRLGRGDVELLLVGSIVGSGAGLRPYAGRFRHLANRPHSELPEIYRSADLFVYPSLHEGSAQAIMEAMACGLPAIVTPNSGSLVRDGIEGRLVPIRDVDALAGAIEELYADRERLRAFGAAARQRAEAHDWNNYAARFAELLAGVAGSSLAQHGRMG
jgi:glycosyltransferase involved in cell wall biosynthesis